MKKIQLLSLLVLLTVTSIVQAKTVNVVAQNMPSTSSLVYYGISYEVVNQPPKVGMTTLPITEMKLEDNAFQFEVVRVEFNNEVYHLEQGQKNQELCHVKFSPNPSEQHTLILNVDPQRKTITCHQQN